ncbi:MAG TPA: nuclear transport factor 2 family protein [Acidimicrobiia bacterium]|nr:nuclear transport factor 2 family protein [Acidimicrobiia bacterium]
MSNVAIVQKALDAIAAGDLDAVMTCLTDDVVFEFPYTDGGTVLDKAGAARTIGFIITTFSARTFHVEEVYDPATPDRVVLEYSSRMRSAVGDVEYSNRYVAIFVFRDGLISLWREYANPLPFFNALAAIKAAAPG